MLAGEFRHLLGNEGRLPRGFILVKFLFHDAARRALERERL